MLNGGHQQQACFIQVDMGADPHVIGQVRGSDVDYSAPLHTQLDYDILECPRWCGYGLRSGLSRL